ncbi:DUF3800 domain-containing protein [Fulvivirgaceae bacterium BMA10]|uniref:DUF3800 domain-containing protein n=1 Tax=Splendidivirga corallicola TaxID=3051826 RepID=A0ABT8KMQ6_9BACT|nr:DUF3800 domain-containing protein [Fulvivirgaceae bacterium BMA10]
MYVDESGDPGIDQYSSPHFILTSLIIHEDEWKEYLNRLKTFRKSLKEKYGLNQRTEIHASELIRIKSIDEYRDIRKTDRINILRDYCGQIPIIFNNVKIINICFKTSDFNDATKLQTTAWARLIQRYDIYLKKNVKDKGIIVADDTDANIIMQLLRKMRVYNPVNSHYSDGYYNAPVDNIIEDIFQRSSHQSYFIQTVDVIAHLLYRKEYPKGSLKKFGIEKMFTRFEPILLKEASKADDFGIVRR